MDFTLIPDQWSRFSIIYILSSDFSIFQEIKRRKKFESFKLQAHGLLLKAAATTLFIGGSLMNFFLLTIE
jgi:hypothetical protein